MMLGRWIVPVVKLLQGVSCRCSNTCACTATLVSNSQRPLNIPIYPCLNGTHHIISYFQNKTWKTDGLAKRLNLVEPPRAPYLAAGWTDTPNTNDVSWEVFFVEKRHQPAGVLEVRSASLAPGPG
ncbi:hypothetical protein CI102_13083 [Trichoderma harzianum]|nr:hypothetical protein CI102_13083 [Trichoderma harzianum]